MGPKNSRVYCDLCKPDLFRSLLVSLMPAAFDETVADVKPVQGRSKIRQYEDTDNDVLLRKLLFEWRDRRAKDFLSSAVIDDLGYEMFFPDEIITRLVDCAHKNKITTADDIDREAKSNSYREFADEIIDIIASVRPPTRPPPLFTSNPLIRKPLQSQTPDPNVAAAVNLGKPKRIMHCSRCGEAGHNGKRPVLLQCLQTFNAVFQRVTKNVAKEVWGRANRRRGRSTLPLHRVSQVRRTAILRRERRVSVHF